MTELAMIAVGGALLLGVILITLPTALPKRSSSIDKQFVARKWNEITTTASRTDQSARFAIIEADKLLDYVLKARGYSGDTMGDRLRSANNDFSYKDDVWHAHKLRNKLVHEAEYQIDSRLIHRGVEQFRQALKDMRAL